MKIYFKNFAKQIISNKIFFINKPIYLCLQLQKYNFKTFGAKSQVSKSIDIDEVNESTVDKVLKYKYSFN